MCGWLMGALPGYILLMHHDDPLGARAFMARMAALNAAKTEDWLTRERGRSIAERLAIADALHAWAHVASPSTNWEALRQEDLESHARVAALFRRADVRLRG